MEKEILKKERKKAIILALNNQSLKNYCFEEDVLEMKNLLDSANIDTLDVISQNLDEENKKTYLGKGKIEEVKMILKSKENETDIDYIVCNDELSPSQIENLEKILEITILDRTFIILEIFESRAKTKEAILQVEIAKLKYMLPRLTGLRKGLSRQSGGKNKGKGETQLELDRRYIEDKISKLKEQLKNLSKERKFQREKRKKTNIKTASLVGYTNSGKSSTLNLILEKYNNSKKVFQEDMLFATLETSTRHIKLENNLEFLLTDTVGFINKLPHSLIEAFKSTLEEIKESDLIIHVVDASNKNYINQIEITNEVLKEISAENIKVLYAFNKIDKVDDYFFIPSQYDNAIRYSAKEKINVEDLIEAIEKNLFSSYKTFTFKIPYDKSSYINLISESSKVINIKYEDYIYIEAFVSEYIYNYLNEYIIK